MTDTMSEIARILQNDPTLLAMLADNEPWLPGGGTAAKKWSIRPAEMGNGELATPFITIGEGTEPRIGEQLKRQEVYIRAYNAITKSYVDINKILDRVRVLLDDSTITISDRVFVRMRSDGRLAGLEDQAYNLKFKEENYGILVL